MRAQKNVPSFNLHPILCQYLVCIVCVILNYDDWVLFGHSYGFTPQVSVSQDTTRNLKLVFRLVLLLRIPFFCLRQLVKVLVVSCQKYQANHKLNRYKSRSNNILSRPFVSVLTSYQSYETSHLNYEWEYLCQKVASWLETSWQLRFFI